MTKKPSALDTFGKRLIKEHMTFDENANADDYIVKYDSATGLFTNKDKDIAFKDVVSARRHNQVYEPYSSKVQTIKKQLNTPSNIAEYHKSKPFVKPRVKPTVTTQVKPKVDNRPINLNVNDELTRLMSRKHFNQETYEQRIQRENFEEMVRQRDYEQLRNKTRGIAYLMGSPDIQKDQKEENMNQNTNTRSKFDL